MSLDTSERIKALDARVGRLEEIVAGIGHNNPPEPIDEPKPDQRLTTIGVARRYSVSRRTVDRWLLSGIPADFPKPEVINGRKYWLVRVLNAWDRTRVLKSIEER